MKGIRLVETCVKTTAAEPSAPVRPITSGVLIIESMPARLRPRVEELMVTCLPSASTWEIPGDDPLTAQWCTRWYKDWPGQDLAALAAGAGSEFDAVPPGIGCRQVLTVLKRSCTRWRRRCAISRSATASRSACRCSRRPRPRSQRPRRCLIEADLEALFRAHRQLNQVERRNPPHIFQPVFTRRFLHPPRDLGDEPRELPPIRIRRGGLSSCSSLPSAARSCAAKSCPSAMRTSVSERLD